MGSMIIIKDERLIDSKGKCEQCGEITIVRPVKIFGWMQQEWGYYYLCFSCFGPRVFWKKSEAGIVRQSLVPQEEGVPDESL